MDSEEITLLPSVIGGAATLILLFVVVYSRIQVKRTEAILQDMLSQLARARTVWQVNAAAGEAQERIRRRRDDD